MATATEPAPVPAFDDLPAPRRTAVALLFHEVLATERDLARLYGSFAERTPIPYLRRAFGALAEAKQARVAAVEALGPGLGVDVGTPALPPPAAAGDAAVEQRAEIFARAFEGERALEVAYREIGALLGDPARCPGLAELEAESARHRTRLRDLYLRYS